MRVDADTGAERRPEARDRARRGREAARRILGVEPDLDRVPAARRPAGQRRAARPAAIRSCSRTMSTPVTSSLTGMLDLQAGVQLDEVEGAVRAEQELERARVLVADRAAGALGRGLHLLARRRDRAPARATPRSSFWWRRWIEHSRSPSVSTPPSLSQSTWISTWRAGHERLLEVERRRPRRPPRPRRSRSSTRPRARPARGRAASPCRRRRRRPSAARGSRARPRPPAPRRASRRPRCRARAARRRPSSPPSRAPCRPSAPSRPRPGRRRRGRSSSHARDEGRVLGEEAVAGVDRLAAGRLGGGDHVRDPEVALGRRRRADADRAGRRAGRGARRRRRSSRRRPPRRRARGARGSPGRRSRRGSRRGRG